MDGQLRELIKRFEGCKLEGYLDVRGVPTIGYGHTGKEARVGSTITQEQAEQLLDRDVERFVTGVRQLVKVEVSPSQFNALVSLAYNIGLEGFRRSSVLRHLNAGNVKQAADDFLLWNKAGPYVSKGLVARRAMERELFLKT